jgi:alpha-tubulin suppressor-like RCC1 family protein
MTASPRELPMAACASPNQSALLDLPLEVFADVCQQLELHDLVRVAETCKRFRHGDGRLETVELPTNSPVLKALRELAFAGGEAIPSTRPMGSSESWVTYLARCARQRRCREVPPIAAGGCRSQFVDAAGRLLTCHNREGSAGLVVPVAAMAGIRMQSVAAGDDHNLALGWDGRVYSWGCNTFGQLGRDVGTHSRLPAPVEGLEGVRGIAAAADHSVAVTHSGSVFSWGRALRCQDPDSPVASDDSEYYDEDAYWRIASRRPIVVEGFQGVRIRRVCADMSVLFAIGQGGELFSWGEGRYCLLGHGLGPTSPCRGASRRCGAFG